MSVDTSQAKAQLKNVMFADIVGSSKLYAQLGNDQAEALIDDIIRHLKAIVSDNLGFIVKTIGDEIMCCFENASEAATAANEMHSLAKKRSVHLRIGVSSGLVVERNNDLFGDTVNNASYLAGVAQASQTLIDNNTKEKLSECIDSICEPYDNVKFKGQNKYSKIFRLNWESDLETHLGATIISAPTTRLMQTVDKRIKLKYQGKVLSLNSEQLPIVFGRDENIVDIHINCPKSSRKHCTLYYEKANFILMDHSTNGTLVKQNDDSEILLKRKSCHLHHQGRISIALATQANIESELNTIYFSII